MLEGLLGRVAVRVGQKWKGTVKRSQKYFHLLFVFVLFWRYLFAVY
jgi:hypothetical protein